MAFVNAAVLPRTGLSYASTSVSVRPATAAPTVHSPLDIRAAKHVQFKGTKKAYRTRPKKHRPSDINRKPPPFNPEPLRAEGLPPVMEIVKAEDAEKFFEGRTVLASAETVQAELAAQQKDSFEESSTVEATDAPEQTDQPE
ncbi:hypothetical protein BWQ96_09059 [Gracilariopsis chorda]|uniref:Uncharacterized protein n=1 Tax=Gracilariopsis chorda TaxID=448386 RepID=A0A2V3IGI8_9FLOR|nr:hypothetical protein BWQ96_09059 [Gracilariopsis chorda]|eukprot:PXF41204.1 hypothetical protein BWQ96_09059 [Gracilariopsis chorda]